ncbi:MAG: ABC transporter permease [Acidobacteria bacterium]|nr:ABC transporter permease [Acidobacteriota bacterium]
MKPADGTMTGHLDRVVRKLTGLDAPSMTSLSLQALGRYKLRTALSVLGIVFGVGTVIAVRSVSEGARFEVLKEVESLGLNNLVVRDRAPLVGQAPVTAGLTLADADHVRRLIPEIVAAATIVQRFPQLSGPVRSTNALVIGANSSYFDVLNLGTDRGRALVPLDDRSTARVCVLGQTLGSTLFGYRDPVGEKIQIGRETYSVVGILRSRGRDARGIGALPARNLNAAAIVSLAGLLGRPVEADRYQRVEELWLQVADGDRVGLLGRVVEHTMSRLHDGRRDVEVIVPRELLEQRYRLQRAFIVVVGSLGVLALLIGGIGIMNIMLASVLERTREIGLRRTVGATRRAITLQFLSETLIISLSGGIVGLVAGVAAVFAISGYAGWSTRVSGTTVILAVATAFLVGLVFGIYPAFRAARLDPIEAVRYE